MDQFFLSFLGHSNFFKPNKQLLQFWNINSKCFRWFICILENLNTCTNVEKKRISWYFHIAIVRCAFWKEFQWNWKPSFYSSTGIDNTLCSTTTFPNKNMLFLPTFFSWNFFLTKKLFSYIIWNVCIKKSTNLEQ